LKNKKRVLTMYKNNSGLIAKTKVSKYKKGLCLTEMSVHKIRYYSYTRPSDCAKTHHLTVLFL